MIVRQRRNADRLRARGGRSDREHGEAEFGKHDRCVRVGETLRDQHQQFVRTVAERDLRRIDAQMNGQGGFQRAALRVRIAQHFGQCSLYRGKRRRTGAQRILV